MYTKGSNLDRNRSSLSFFFSPTPYFEASGFPNRVLCLVLVRNAKIGHWQPRYNHMTLCSNWQIPRANNNYHFLTQNNLPKFRCRKQIKNIKQHSKYPPSVSIQFLPFLDVDTSTVRTLRLRSFISCHLYSDLM